jgi:hypothetical protein
MKNVSIYVKINLDTLRNGCYICFDDYQNKLENERGFNVEEFIKALRDQHAALNQQAAELRALDKGDEAVFSTVRANVYDICATVLGVQVKKGDIPGFSRMLDRFKNEWGAALEAAKRQDNAKKICVEETKLEALADVRAHFAELRCE